MSIPWIIAWIVSLIIAYFIGKRSALPDLLQGLVKMGQSIQQPIDNKEVTEHGGNTNKECSG
jgi:hypothetical protein